MNLALFFALTLLNQLVNSQYVDVKKLIDSMTVEDKCGQMNQITLVTYLIINNSLLDDNNHNTLVLN